MTYVILLKNFRNALVRLSGRGLLVFLLLHYWVSWWVLALLDEDKITTFPVWTYFYITTATTIGYGDFSPSTELGRWFTALWLMPGGVCIFAALIGKATQSIAERWKRGMLGKDQFYELADHTLIIGWHGELTERMINLLQEDESTKDRPIILCANQEIENPLPKRVHFVRGESFTHAELLNRAGVKGADRILIYAHNDEQALATAMAVLSLNPTGHIVVHFQEEGNARILRHYAPHVEITCSLSMELMVRAAQDPGSSWITQELLSVLSGPTQYSVLNLATIEYGKLFVSAKEKLGVTLIGFGINSQPPVLNPNNQELIPAQATLYYIGSQRFNSSEWSILYV